MKTSFLKTIAAVTAMSLVSVNVALAGGKGGNGGSSNHSNSFKTAFGGGGGGNNNSNKKSNSSSIGKAIAIGAAISAARSYSNNGKYNNGGNYNNGGQCNNNNNNNGSCNGGYNSGGYGQVNVTNDPNVGQAFEPFHSNYVVLPGDSFFTISLKEYSTSSNAKHIARFNNLPQSAALTPGQIIQLPSISVNGALTVSRAPIADELQNGTTGSPVANFTNSTNTTAATSPIDNTPRPKVNVGSTLLVDGQSFGDQQGAARLRVGGAALKVEVVEWNGSSVKIRLPQLDLDTATNADIEVVRADGSLASKTGVELGSATEVALTR